MAWQNRGDRKVCRRIARVASPPGVHVASPAWSMDQLPPFALKQRLQPPLIFLALRPPQSLSNVTNAKTGDDRPLHDSRWCLERGLKGNAVRLGNRPNPRLSLQL
jgi:hypothetical protein